MAWIESNQELADHPKTRKLARVLETSIPAAVGHLHCLWWWALDYADDGDLTRFDDLDIALGARWEGDESSFMAALISSGFVDPDHCIHDWEQYTGKLVSRRRANAARMRDARAAEKPERASEVGDRASHVHGTQRARVEPQDRTRHNSTEHNSTEPNQETSRAPAPAREPEKPVEPDSGADAPPSSEPSLHPFALLEALCDEQGQDTSVLSKHDRGKQLAVAKRLVAAGMTEADIRTMTRWLVSQSWITGGVDLFLVEKQQAKWQLAGKPKAGQANSRASPGSNGGPGVADANGFMLRRKDGGYTPEGMAAMARAEEQEAQR